MDSKLLASADRNRRHRERGFSLIEVLIASLIMLFVALAIIPLFTMSAANNLQGSDSTKAANFARDRIELIWQLPFTDPQITLTAGTSKQLFEYYDEVNKTWVTQATLNPPAGTIWTRITTIRQFTVDDLATPLPFDADPQLVSMKEAKVEVKNARVGGPLGGGKELTIVAYRSA